MKFFFLVTLTLIFGFQNARPSIADESLRTMNNKASHIVAVKSSETMKDPQGELDKPKHIRLDEPTPNEQIDEKKSETSTPPDLKEPKNPGVVDEAAPGKEKGIDKKEAEKVKSTDKKAADKVKDPIRKYPPDRGWIIKQRDDKKRKFPQKKPPPINWENERQRAQCRSNLKHLKQEFLQARYYSIKGDFCATAEYASAFLKLCDVCEQDCPQGFLERNGYTNDLIRNLNRLYELGRDRCLGPK